MRTSKLADEAGIGWLRAGSDSGAGQASLPDTAMTSLPVLTRACRWTPVESVGVSCAELGGKDAPSRASGWSRPARGSLERRGLSNEPCCSGVNGGWNRRLKQPAVPLRPVLMTLIILASTSVAAAQGVRRVLVLFPSVTGRRGSCGSARAFEPSSRHARTSGSKSRTSTSTPLASRTNDTRGVWRMTVSPRRPCATSTSTAAPATPGSSCTGARGRSTWGSPMTAPASTPARPSLGGARPGQHAGEASHRCPTAVS